MCSSVFHEWCLSLFDFAFAVFSLCLFLCRIVEKGYYSERDAADAVKQILAAVAVSSYSFPLKKKSI